MTTTNTLTANVALADDVTLVTSTGSIPLTLPSTASVGVSGQAPAAANQVAVDKLPAFAAMRELEDIVAARQVWQDTAYKTSNDMLYRILERCYSYYHKLSTDSEDGKKAREGLKLYIETRGLNFKKTTHTIAKILACVFGTDRRRISAYSIALRSALQHEIAVSELLDYITKAGGVEELRLKKNPDAKTVKSKAETATSWLAEYNLASVRSDQLIAESDAANVGSQHVLLVSQCADGSFNVHGILSNQGVVDATLAAFYAKHNKARQKSSATTEISQAVAATNDLIAQAAAQTHQ